MPSNAPHTSIRFEPEVREGLNEYCKRTRRSLNSAVNTLLTEALAEDYYRREKARPGRGSLVELGDYKVCGRCDGGYYGESCPSCDQGGR